VNFETATHTFQSPKDATRCPFSLETAPAARNNYNFLEHFAITSCNPFAWRYRLFGEATNWIDLYSLKWIISPD